MSRSSNKQPSEGKRMAQSRNVEPVSPKPVDLAISSYLASIGRKGGLKGGKARSEALSKARRSEIAQLAAKARWHND